MTMLFQARPLVVEAIQLRKNNLQAVEDFLGGKAFYKTRFAINWGNSHVKVKTIDGTRKAVPGNWIVKRSSDDYFICRDDVFRATYEPA
jgi:hypothetical protein